MVIISFETLHSLFTPLIERQLDLEIESGFTRGARLIFLFLSLMLLGITLATLEMSNLVTALTLNALFSSLLIAFYLCMGRQKFKREYHPVFPLVTKIFGNLAMAVFGFFISADFIFHFLNIATLLSGPFFLLIGLVQAVSAVVQWIETFSRGRVLWNESEETSPISWKRRVKEILPGACVGVSSGVMAGMFIAGAIIAMATGGAFPTGLILAFYITALVSSISRFVCEAFHEKQISRARFSVERPAERIRIQYYGAVGSVVPSVEPTASPIDEAEEGIGLMPSSLRSS